MSRVAKWRRAPGDPETARGWLLRVERSQESSPPVDWRRTLLVVGLVLGWVLIAALLVAAVPNGRHYFPFLCLFWPILTTWNNRKPNVAPTEERAEPEESFPVELAICAPNTLSTGHDRGQLIFCDGWLLFEGRRTEFAVTRGEADGRLESRSVRLRLEDGRTIDLSLPEGARAEPLKRAYDLWHATAPPDGEAVLPPVEVHPEVWSARWRFCLLGAAFSAVPTTVGIALGLWLLAIPAVLTTVACSIVAGLYARRLRQELPKALPIPPSSLPPAHEASGTSPQEARGA